MAITLLDVLKTPLTRFRAPAAKGFDGGVVDDMTLEGVSLIAKGEALGHGMWIDSQALTQVAELGNQAGKGVKVRFTHPGLSSDGLGTFLGRAHNLSVDDEAGKVIGDVVLSPSASKTPDGDLASYVLRLAEDDPESFGMSIVFETDSMAMAEFMDEFSTEEDGFISPDSNNFSNLPHVRVGKLTAVDFVDEPAANPDGLFHAKNNVLGEAEDVAEYVLGLTDIKPETNLDLDRTKQFLARFLTGHNLEIQQIEPMAEPATEPETTTLDVADEPVTVLSTEEFDQRARVIASESIATERERTNDIEEFLNNPSYGIPVCLHAEIRKMNFSKEQLQNWYLEKFLTGEEYQAHRLQPQEITGSDETSTLSESEKIAERLAKATDPKEKFRLAKKAVELKTAELETANS